MTAITSCLNVSEYSVAVTVAQVLGIPPHTIDPETRLTAYGIDSLGAMQVVAALEDQFRCSLPESLLTDCSNLRQLTDVLRRSSFPDDTDVQAAVALREQMIADSLLDDDICPAGAGRAPGTPPRALLTGATGFLGAALLRALIDSGVHVVCPVRARSVSPTTRVRTALETYGLWRDSDARSFQAIAADLEQPRLGVSRDVYERLAGDTDAVFHAAADVNWVSDYTSLRASNVSATRSLLRFACTHRLKRFHFVSSLSVCMAVDGPAVVSEQTDMLPHAERLPLGYAQSKCVGESLVRAAASRGLPAQIYRPALLAGHASSGASNPDDLIAALLRGCIQLGAAPDLDWTFDAVPVDTAAAAIVALSRSCGSGLDTFHLRHPRPRHWRECVLWTNFFGYPIRLEPYGEWTERLRRDARSAEHALYLLRGFFTRRIHGRTAPEHYQEGAHGPIDCRRTRGHERLAGIDYPPLDACRLDSYLSDLVRRGALPPPASRRAATPPSADRTWGTRCEYALRQYFRDDRLRVRDAAIVKQGSEHSIISEMTSWKRGQQTGLFHYRLALQRGPRATSFDLVAKIKPPDEDVMDVAETTAAVVDLHLHRQIRKFRDRLGARGGHVRELEIYRLHAREPVGRYLPQCYGSWADEERQQWTLLLEHLHGMAIMDAQDPAMWTDPFRMAAIDGLAAFHARWLGREHELAAYPWIGHIPTMETLIEMRPLWATLARHAAPMFQAWAGPSVVDDHARLAATPERWAPALETVPRTLIHNDFNTRNVAVRHTVSGPQLVAYDWELATIGAPQRDLAEFLCFVLPEHVTKPVLAAAIERHRSMLERHSGQTLGRREWHDGFGSALAHLLVSRLALYAMIHRVRPLAFLPQVVRTWSRIHDLTTAAGESRDATRRRRRA